MPAWLIVIATSAYVAALFWVAARRDRRAHHNAAPISPTTYALALGVYCTSWTFYGAVGTAASAGWTYLPIYLGPALVFLFAPGFIQRLGDVAQREGVSSLSDFLSARYGKSRTVAATATIAAVMGSVPYIALQLQSVGMSFQALAQTDAAAPGPPGAETVFLTAVVMAVFAIMFGARTADTTRRNAGLMKVLALESLVKLAALCAVAVLSLSLLGEADVQRVSEARAQFDFGGAAGDFITITVLAMAAIVCLPRQFHVAAVERVSTADVKRARWLFPAYMVATSLVVLPIVLAGAGTLPQSTPSDLYVLALPLEAGNTLLSLTVFIGGFSAATGMVIVSSVALSTMITNDLVVPVWMRLRGAPFGPGTGERVLAARRFAIVAVLALAYGYYRASGGGEALAAIGLLSFAAAIQFAPALLGALYWRQGHRNGAVAGVAAGVAVWAYTLALPALLGPERLAAWSPPAVINPYALFGLDLGSPLLHGVVWSLAVNVIAYVALSLRAKVRLTDQVQAAAFTGLSPGPATPGEAASPEDETLASPDGLRALASRFLSPAAVDHAFARFAQQTNIPAIGSEPADIRLMQETERLLARVIGAASARVVMSSALAGGAVALDDVLSILDQQTIAQRFDRHMLQSMLEHMAQGISVVDGEQRLVAWNSAYVTLFSYPPELVQVGRPIADLIRHNVAAGWIHGEDPDAVAQRRLSHMRAGTPYSYERGLADGRHLRITGSPMPGGGYVTTFTDITEDKLRERALIDLNATLEARVTARTEDLAVMAEDLDHARKDAEAANASKTRFLAAASHDLLQPLNAARLFLTAARETPSQDQAADLAVKADRAIVSADSLLKGLLDISRLDHGEIVARPEVFPAGPLIEDLVDEAEGMARATGLTLHAAPTSLWVRADPDFLQSILRNFLSNARRYTRTGGVLIGVRPRGDKARFEVWDTGPGIPEERQARIFEEFQRFEEADNVGVRGAGLGLAIARRLADLMDARIGVRSVLGRGSVFFLEADRVREKTPALRSSDTSRVGLVALEALKGLRVLCVDDEPAILDALSSLLNAWGCQVDLARSPQEALASADRHVPEAILLDLQLGDAEATGFTVIDALRNHQGVSAPAALVTAETDDAVADQARRRSLTLLRKPVDPNALRMFLIEAATRAAAP